MMNKNKRMIILLRKFKSITLHIVHSLVHRKASGIILDFKRDGVERHDHLVLANVVLNLRNSDVAICNEREDRYSLRAK